MNKTIVNTSDAPAAIGTYSQAVRRGHMLFVSGQIPLVRKTGEMISDDFGQQVRQVFANLEAIAHAADSDLNDIVKLIVYVTNLENFEQINEVMAEILEEPYPARSAVQVAALPKGAHIEIDAIFYIS